MAPRPPSAVTRSIYLGTFAAIALVATLTLVIYRSEVDEAVVQHSNQQLAMVRTAAIGVQGEIQSMTARLRQFASLPSVQNLEVPVLSQRVEAAFGDNASGLINLIVRADVDGRLFFWTPEGELLGKGDTTYKDDELWRWASNRANASKVRMVHGWANSVSSRRAIAIPVWRSSPSTENPTPSNEFGGVIALVVDLNRFVEVYLGPAMSDLSDSRLIVGLETPEFGVRMGPGRDGVKPTEAEGHNHVERQGTTIMDDADGRRLHAWAKLDAAGETWIVASSASYSLVAGIRRSALAQLGLTAMLLVAVPLVGWLIARRERQIQQEQRDLERRLAESQKMEAIGKLAGGVAHDFNNMLTAILGYSSMIHEDAPPKSVIRDQALQIRRAAESAAALTQKLLAFSRKQVLQADPVDVRSLVGNMLPLIGNAVGEDIAVSTEMARDLWPILADPTQVEQSILNLAINARDAMPDGGTLQITARNAPRPDGERRHHDTDVKPGDYVQLTAIDTGVGMDDATRARMFEPFFTTKPPGKGTGLGLSTVYGFVRQCGGYIGVSSTPGHGTSIELLLPKAEAPVAPAAPQPQQDLETRHLAETVVIAEDEAGVRQLAVETLARRGYRVLAAQSGEEALALAGAHDGRIHLLISDVVMPGMKGPELADRMRAMRPGIRVLLMSGYATEMVTPADLREAAFLSKPFAPAALLNAVRHILDVPLSSAPASQR